MGLRSIALRWACLVVATLLGGDALAADRFEEAPIHYSTATPSNPIEQLATALANNSVSLAYEDSAGYLKSLLDALKVPVDSQVLVFSKSSLQTQSISPEHPRAIYFNDEIYVGSVQYGEHLEISVADPALGTVFYTLTQRKSDRPELVRQSDNCLQCHASSLTYGIPGHIVRSLFTDDNGFPILRAGSFVTTQDSPFDERWGGWYVTGTHGAARHMGNVTAVATERDATLDTEHGANRLTLDERVDSENYLTKHSDIVALCVLEHQTQMHNLITQANFETKFALRDQAVIDEILKPEVPALSESTQRRIRSAGEKLLEYLLFANEAPITASIRGTSGFAERFSAQGPFDQKGRSLRELDLNTRLFKYPLSYLIYSPQFDGLPQEMKDYLFRRIWDVLAGTQPDAKFNHLDSATRQAIREILIDTKPGLPAYWVRSK